jgi:alkylated DNA repair dioxygenase AlkB
MARAAGPADPAAAPPGFRDVPDFLSGVSLGASCVMRFRRGSRPDRELRRVPLAPRSAYVLSGAARAAWQHSVPPVSALRYSITFRTLRRSGSPSPAPSP